VKVSSRGNILCYGGKTFFFKKKKTPKNQKSVDQVLHHGAKKFIQEQGDSAVSISEDKNIRCSEFLSLQRLQ